MDDVRLSEHFTLKELCYSPTALTRDIPNVPTTEEIACMIDLVNYVLEPLRELVGKPIYVSSGFRSAALNRAVGGEHGSQHVKGQAADIEVAGLSSMELFRLIVDNLPFDQCIEEYGKWVHVSYKKAGNRHEGLQAVKLGGRTVYNALA